MEKDRQVGRQIVCHFKGICSVPGLESEGSKPRQNDKVKGTEAGTGRIKIGHYRA